MPSSLLSLEQSALLVIDMQEKLLPLMEHRDRILKQTRILLEAARILSVPVMVTEQYPQGLGATVHDLRDALPDRAIVLEKTAFGAVEAPGFTDALQACGRSQVIVCGIEAHICVTQTTLQLLELGKTVFLAHDAVSSRQKRNLKAALWRMTQAGAIPFTSEMALFEWTRTANCPPFKALQALIK
ncbi:MAG: hydrolase [Vampirovibrionales bacterium]|nr:hydrolase [Vampirovibrionales bacterium]